MYILPKNAFGVARRRTKPVLLTPQYQMTVAGMKQIEIDFGTLPILEKTFTVYNPFVTATSTITARVAYEAPTGKDLDELEFDDLELKCQTDEGLFNIYARSRSGFVAGNFKINCTVAY